MNRVLNLSVTLVARPGVSNEMNLTPDHRDELGGFGYPNGALIGCGDAKLLGF